MKRLPASIRIERRLKKEVLRRRSLAKRLHASNELVIQLQRDHERALFIERESARLTDSIAKALTGENPFLKLIEGGKFPEGVSEEIRETENSPYYRRS